jgi:hypothetical protein
MEMVGLVFVVVILVLGIVLYLQFASKARSPVAQQSQASSSFLTALADTYVPACNVRFSEVARECASGGFSDLVCGDPCAEAQIVMNKIAAVTLLREGKKFNLSLSGKNVQYVSGCNSADPTVQIVAAPQIVIPLGSGRVANLGLALCR